ncbi:MAG TPA: cytochrome c [Methylomirabilota bacterium]
MRSSRFLVVTAAALFAVAVTVGWLVDHAPGFAQGLTGGAPPFDLSDTKVIGEGAQLFRQTCTGYCHGKDGGPSRAPKLRGAKLERGYVYARISKGSPNGMPGFETLMPRENIWKLVAYVLSLSKVEDK